MSTLLNVLFVNILKNKCEIKQITTTQDSNTFQTTNSSTMNDNPFKSQF